MTELKKRGRKSAKNAESPIQELILKNDDTTKSSEKQITPPTSSSSTPSTPLPTPTETSESDLSKKRGRKPKQKTYSVQDVIISKATSQNKEHVILHFPFGVKDVYNSDPFNNILEYKSAISEPQPFEPDCQANFSSLSTVDNLSHAYFIKSGSPKTVAKPSAGNILSYIQPDVAEEEDSTMATAAIEEDSTAEMDAKEMEELDELAHKYENEIYVQNSFSPFNNEKVIMKKNLNKIMYEFIEANKKGEWPMNTNIYCMWCCHPFEGPPCALPVKYVNEVFHVCGCFCSFNCAAAYNFKEYKQSEVWERYSLLNLMYKKIFNKSFIKIKSAPPREVLTIFGGYLNIDDYRKNMIINDREYKIIRPPIVSIVPKVEESIIEFTNSEPIPVDKDKIDQAVEKLKLKRNKPLTKSMQTLEDFMNIKYC